MSKEAINKNHPLFNAVEEAVFLMQCSNANEVYRYLRQQDYKKLDHSTINELIHAVATQYKTR